MSGRQLILLRHGETEYNAEGRVQGQGDSELTEAGRHQAQTAADYLSRRFAVASLTASDLSRTRATAAPLARATGLDVSYDPRLRERDFGSWQHRWQAEVAETEPRSWHRWTHQRLLDAEGAETAEQVADRMTNALIEIGDNLGPDQTALVVSHGMAILLAVARLVGLPEPLQTLSGMDNTGWALLRPRVDGLGWSLRYYNQRCD